MSIERTKTNAWQGDDAAERYHVNTIDTPPFFGLAREEIYLSYVQEFVEPGGKILDLGCGSGIISRRLHDLGYKVVGCDVSQGMLNKCRELQDGRDYELRLGNGLKIPAKTGEFDAVISRMFIQHFANWREIVREKARVARNGGRILFDFGNSEHYTPYAARLGAETGYPYSANERDKVRFYAVATRSDFESLANRLNLKLDGVFPFGLFITNAALWDGLGAEGWSELEAKISRQLSDPKVRDFYLLIEREVLPHLPATTSYSSMVVLTKSGDTPLLGPLARVFQKLFRR